MIACTHNHAGPDTDIPAGAAERLRLHVIERIAEAVDAAHGRMREARTGTACATLDGIARNRRLLCGDGTVVTLRRSVPSSWLPLRAVQFEAGPVDRDLTVLRIEDLDGEPIALLSSVGCHNDTGGAYPSIGISGDFFGHAMFTLERIHPGCTALIAFGAGGDVDFDFLPGLNRSRGAGRAPLSAVRTSARGSDRHRRRARGSGRRRLSRNPVGMYPLAGAPQVPLRVVQGGSG